MRAEKNIIYHVDSPCGVFHFTAIIVPSSSSSTSDRLPCPMRYLSTYVYGIRIALSLSDSISTLHCNSYRLRKVDATVHGNAFKENERRRKNTWKNSIKQKSGSKERERTKWRGEQKMVKRNQFSVLCEMTLHPNTLATHTSTRLFRSSWCGPMAGSAIVSERYVIQGIDMISCERRRKSFAIEFRLCNMVDRVG